MIRPLLFIFLLIYLSYAADSHADHDSNAEIDASMIQKHTTGPNCWVKNTKITYGSTIQGYNSLANKTNIDVISKHINHPVFLNMTEINFSCIDGRYPNGIVATVGGDAAEFILMLNIANLNNIYLDDFVILGLFRKYISNMEPLRKFYMHTDDHSYSHLLQSLNLTSTFDIHNTPDELMSLMLQNVVLPSNIGCGHLKQIMAQPDKYLTPAWITKGFFRAFFQYMWLEDRERTVENRKLLYVILTGSHLEQGILEVDNDGCPGMAASVPSASSNGMFFILHSAATSFLRTSMSTFLMNQFPASFHDRSNDLLLFKGKMDEFGNAQLGFTAAKLAAGLSIYKVSVQGSELSLLDSITGMLIAISISFIVAVCVAIVVYRRPVVSEDIIIHSKIVQNGTNAFIVRLLVIIFPVFLIVGLIFLAGFDYPVMLCIWASTFISIFAASGVLFSAPLTYTRAASATLLRMEEGIQVAIQSGVVVGIIITSPLLFVIAIVCLTTNASQQALIAFAFGSTLVGLLVRVGGSIFSNAVLSTLNEIREGQKRKLSVEDANASISGMEIFSDKKYRLFAFVSNSVVEVMGSTSDLANSAIIALISAFIVGTKLYGDDGIALPLYLMASGLFSSIIAFSIVVLILHLSVTDTDKEFAPINSVKSFFSVVSGGSICEVKILRVLRLGYIIGTGLFLLIAYFVNNALHFEMDMYYCIVIGHLGGMILSITSEIAAKKDDIAPLLGLKLNSNMLDVEASSISSEEIVPLNGNEKPIVAQESAIMSAQKKLRSLVKPLSSGLLNALLVGLSSSLAPVIIIFAILLWCASISHTLGVVIAGVSFMSNCMFSIGYSVVSPILTNSYAILKMTNQVDSVLIEAKALKLLGSTVSDTVKGFTAAAASVVSFCLFIAFTALSGVDSIDLIVDPTLMPGLLLGAMMPFIFAGLTLTTVASVGKRISSHIESIVDIGSQTDEEFLLFTTQFGLSSAMWHLMVPTFFAIGITELVQYLFGVKVLAGFIAGTIVSGLVTSTAMTSTGVTMDNGTDKNAGLFSGALKNAGGPSINMLTKLVIIISVVLISQHTSVLFIVNMCIVGLVATVYIYNVVNMGQASFDPAMLSTKISEVAHLKSASSRDIVLESAKVEESLSLPSSLV